jgi:serine protease Do
MAGMGHKTTLYDFLGVARDASAADIGRAHERRRAELERAVPQDPSALAMLHEAHEVLADGDRRTAYDAALLSASEKAIAKEQAATPDFVVEAGDDDAPRFKVPPVGIAIAAVAILAAILFFVKGRHPPPPAQAASEPPAEARPAPPPAPTVPQAKSAQDVLTAGLAATGRLQRIDISGNATPIGLAVAIAPNAMVTTCHGIPAGAQLVVAMGAETHSATLALTDEVLDLCRLAVPALDAKPLAIASAEPRPGDRIYALGANAAGEFALTEGTVKQLLPEARGRMIEVSMPIAPQSSGGAIFDDHGKLLAIATTTQGHGPGVNLALPVGWVEKLRSRTRAQ